MLVIHWKRFTSEETRTHDLRVWCLLLCLCFLRYTNRSRWISPGGRTFCPLRRDGEYAPFKGCGNSVLSSLHSSAHTCACNYAFTYFGSITTDTTGLDGVDATSNMHIHYFYFPAILASTAGQLSLTFAWKSSATLYEVYRVSVVCVSILPNEPLRIAMQCAEMFPDICFSGRIQRLFYCASNSSALPL